MTHSIRWDDQRVCVSYSGQCSDDEVLRAVIQIQADSRFDGTYQALHDFTECEAMSFSEKKPVLEELSARNFAAAAFNKRLRIAIVTDRPDVLAMLESFNNIGLSPFPMHVFGNTESASVWLTGSRI